MSKLTSDAPSRPGQSVGMSAPRYAIGIDLGTTHSALAFVDLSAGDGQALGAEVMAVPQLSAPGTVEALPLLPSFLYLPHADELAPGELTLPWSSEARDVVGEMARRRGATTPIRLVASAKSWLCHPASTAVPPSCRTTRRPRWPGYHRWRPRCAIWRTCARLGTMCTPTPCSPSRT